MRTLFFLLLCTLGAGAVAAEQPADLQPVPPPPGLDANGAAPDEPQVTITTQTEQTVEEYRVGGRLYMIKVTPKHGHPYYLIDSLGDGKFSRQESLDSGVRVPHWILKKF